MLKVRSGSQPVAAGYTSKCNLTPSLLPQAGSQILPHTKHISQPDLTPNLLLQAGCQILPAATQITCRTLNSLMNTTTTANTDKSDKSWQNPNQTDPISFHKKNLPGGGGQVG